LSTIIVYPVIMKCWN